MREKRFNVSIIGGGLIGCVAAIALSRLGYKVAIIEKKELDKFNKVNEDTRTIAISEGSKEFLKVIGVWKEIYKYAQPIKKIKIFDNKIINKLDFDNSRRKSNLGYIVKNKKLLEIFYKNILKMNNISLFNNSHLLSINHNQDFNILNIGKKYFVISDLNIAADGKKSATRDLLKTPIYKKSYNKFALVFTFEHSKSHNDTALEFFYNNGPLAVLPMQNQNGKKLSSIVWTDNEDYLRNLLNCEDNLIKLTLNKKTQNQIGNITKIYTKQLFPITAHLNSRFYEKGNIYIGDSAHSVHPIAGQGWNLGIKDVNSLYKISKKYRELGMDLGNNFFCKEYNNQTYFEAYRLYQITDKLDNLFRQNNFFINFIRAKGINYIQRKQLLKNNISDFAMGIN